MERAKHFEVTLECYMVELYLEKLNDLLEGGIRAHESNMNKDELKIREDSVTNEVYIQNAKMKALTSVEDALETFESGLKSRKVHSTSMNDQSSRSHLIFGVVVTSKNMNTGEITRGKISFVDLAGSERQSKSNPGRDPQL